jgi:hypothetical protein
MQGEPDRSSCRILRGYAWLRSHQHIRSSRCTESASAASTFRSCMNLARALYEKVGWSRDLAAGGSLAIRPRFLTIKTLFMTSNRGTSLHRLRFGDDHVCMRPPSFCDDLMIRGACPNFIFAILMARTWLGSLDRRTPSSKWRSLIKASSSLLRCPPYPIVQK